MDDRDWLVSRFEDNRAQLHAVAYRMLGSPSEADDAVQETWLRLSRSDASEIENLGGWLTTVVARVCLNMLRSRATRREDSLDAAVPDLIVSPVDQAGPEQQAVLADSVGLALLVVLETLAPTERLAFVLHDMFGVPFEEIAAIIDRTPAASRQLASRARRRVRGQASDQASGQVPSHDPRPGADLPRQWEVVNAFFAAARDGDFAALVAVLDPDVVLRADGGTGRPDVTAVIRGAHAVASQALMFATRAPYVHPALMNGAPGVVVAPGGRPVSVMGFTVAHGRITEINSVLDPERLSQLGEWP